MDSGHVTLYLAPFRERGGGIHFMRTSWMSLVLSQEELSEDRIYQYTSTD